MGGGQLSLLILLVVLVAIRRADHEILLKCLWVLAKDNEVALDSFLAGTVSNFPPS